VGYLYAGAYNPNDQVLIPTSQLKLGDSVFFSLNHVGVSSAKVTETFRLSAFLFSPTQEDGTNVFQMGTNINASYGVANPQDFSYEIGGQFYFPVQRVINGQFTTEPNASYGPRFYATPSYAFTKDFAVGALVKYVLPNGYSAGNTFYDGGGWVFGLEPSYKLELDKDSALKFSAAYDYIAHLNGGVDANGNLTDVIYSRWTVGADYQVRL